MIFRKYPSGAACWFEAHILSDSLRYSAQFVCCLPIREMSIGYVPQSPWVQFLSLLFEKKHLHTDRRWTHFVFANFESRLCSFLSDLLITVTRHEPETTQRTCWSSSCIRCILIWMSTYVLSISLIWNFKAMRSKAYTLRLTYHKHAFSKQNFTNNTDSTQRSSILVIRSSHRGAHFCTHS